MKNNKNKDDKAYDLRLIFEQMELDLIKKLKQAFFFHKIEEQKEGFQFEQWQLAKLRALEGYRKRNKKLVASYNKPIQEAIDRELKKNYSKGQNIFVRLINKIKKMFNIKLTGTFEFPSNIETPKGIRETLATALGNAIPPKETDFFGANDKKLNALQEVVTKDLKKAQVSVLRKMDDVYRQTIFKTHFYLQSGTKTLKQAIDMATKDFLDKGINSITYKDGKRVNIASYAEMCLRTASHRATLLGEGKKRDEYGIHLVVVTAHANTCKMCAPYQGKVLIDDIFSHPSKEYIEEYSKKYKLLSEAVKDGLLHPNCRHTITTFFEGITQIPEIPDSKEAIETYEAEQKQRAHERAIRKWKRIREGSCDETNKEEAEKKVRLHQKLIRDILKKHTELRRNYTREEVKLQGKKPDEFGLKDIKVHKSVGAAAKKIYVKSDIDIRNTYTIKQGSSITSVKVIAGKGVTRQIDDISRLVEQYKKYNGEKTLPNDWQKVIGFAKIEERNQIAEIHWYQCKDIGKVEFKIKRWLNEG